MDNHLAGTVETDICSIYFPVSEMILARLSSRGVFGRGYKRTIWSSLQKLHVPEVTTAAMLGLGAHSSRSFCPSEWPGMWRGRSCMCGEKKMIHQKLCKTGVRAPKLPGGSVLQTGEDSGEINIKTWRRNVGFWLFFWAGIKCDKCLL